MWGGMAAYIDAPYPKKDAGGWLGGIELSVEMTDRLNAVSAYLCIYPVPAKGVTEFMQKLVPDAKWHTRKNYATNYGRWKCKRGAQVLIDHIDQVEHFIRSNPVADLIAEEIEAAKKKKAKSAEVKLEKQKLAAKDLAEVMERNFQREVKLATEKLAAEKLAAQNEKRRQAAEKKRLAAEKQSEARAVQARSDGKPAPEAHIVALMAEMRRLRSKGIASHHLQSHFEIQKFKLEPHLVAQLGEVEHKLLVLKVEYKSRQKDMLPCEKADNVKAYHTVRAHLWGDETGNANIMMSFLSDASQRQLVLRIAKLSRYMMYDSLREEKLKIARLNAQLLNARQATVALTHADLSQEQVMQGKTVLNAWIATLTSRISDAKQQVLAQLRFVDVFLILALPTEENARWTHGTNRIRGESGQEMRAIADLVSARSRVPKPTALSVIADQRKKDVAAIERQAQYGTLVEKTIGEP
jgi:hypothetical protein